MKWFFSLITVLMCLTAYSGLSNKRNICHQKPLKQIVCTTTFVADVVARLVSDIAEVSVLIPSNADPHGYRMTYGERARLYQADAVFCSGGGLEQSRTLNRILTRCQAFALVDQNPRWPLFRIEGNPHAWMDLSFWAATALPVAQYLGTLWPEHRILFEQRAYQIQTQWEQEHRFLQQLGATIPKEKRYVFVAHDGLEYFYRAYFSDSLDNWREKLYAPEGRSEGAELSLYEMRRAIAFVRQHRLSCVIPEYGSSVQSLKALCRYGSWQEACAPTIARSIYIDSRPQSVPYEEMMRHNIAVLMESMKGSGG